MQLQVSPFAATLSWILLAGAPTSITLEDIALVTIRADLDEKIKKSLDSLKYSRVEYRDHLGEGAGTWDIDPRYESGIVNCMTWIQMVITRTYAPAPAFEPMILDKIRYFDGIPAYGTRKHFVDQWVSIDPGPLRPVDLSGCAEVGEKKITIYAGQFGHASGYNCPMYRDDPDEITVNWVSARGLKACKSKLKNRFYIAFPLANRRYIEKYGNESGEMALVHGFVIEVEKNRHSDDRLRFHHASVGRRKIAAFEPSYFEHSTIFDGLALFELDPDWAWWTSAMPDQKIIEIVACEKKLVSMGFKRKRDFPLKKL